MNIFLRWILIVYLCLLYNSSNATAQFGDILIDGTDTFVLFSNPLEQYLATKPNRTFNGDDLKMHSTACYRGYLATWEIKNDSLFLLSVLKGCHVDDKPMFFDLKKEFGTERVFTSWFTGNLYSPRGQIIHYVHGGYASLFEKEKLYTIEKGIIKKRRQVNNVIYNKHRISPVITLLRDSLKQLIIQTLDTSDIQQFPEEGTCEIDIHFNASGGIDSVTNGFNYDGVSLMEETVLASAKKSVAGFPLLMKVKRSLTKGKYRRYYPPHIGVFFTAHCLKYPEDKAYGCRY